MMRRVFAAVSILVFIIGAALLVSAVVNRSVPRSYKVTYVSDTDGKSTGVVERLVALDGRYRELKKNFDGNTFVTIANADGAFTQLNTDQWQFLSNLKSQNTNALYRSENFLSNHPQLIRTEQLLGYKVYVLWAGDDVGGVEQWFAPEFGSTPLKTVFKEKGVVLTSIEAVKIEFQDVSESELAVYGPVGFEAATQRAQDYRVNGAEDRAVGLEQAIQQKRAQKE